MKKIETMIGNIITNAVYQVEASYHEWEDAVIAIRFVIENHGVDAKNN